MESDDQAVATVVIAVIICLIIFILAVNIRWYKVKKAQIDSGYIQKVIETKSHETIWVIDPNK